MSRDTAKRTSRYSLVGVICLAAAWYVISYLTGAPFQLSTTVAQQSTPQPDANSTNAASSDANSTAPAPKAGGDFLSDFGNPADAAKTEQPVAEQPAVKFGQTDEIDAILAKRGTMQVRQATLDEWMLTIMKVWNIDIRYDPEELRKVSYAGQFTNRPLQEVLDIMLYDRGFGYRKVGNGISVLLQEQIGNWTNQQRFVVIPMEFSNPAEVMPTLTFLLSPKGTVQALTSPKALTVRDLPENVEQVKVYVEKLENLSREVHAKQQVEKEKQDENARQQELRSRELEAPVQPVEQTKYTVIPIQFMTADALVEAITAQITDVTANVIEGENKLLVSGPEPSLLSVAQLIREIDRPRKQVRVSIRMYDVSVEALEQLGVNWRSAGKGRLDALGVPNTLGDFNSAPMQLSSSGGTSSSSSSSSSTSTGTSTATTGNASGYPSASTFLTSASPPLLGSALNLYHISKYFDVNAVILALDQNTGARLLASPVQTVCDRTECEIRIITEIPVQQLTQTSEGGQIGTTTFREAGTTMKVTPWICNDGSVVLNVTPEFSLLRGFNGVQPIIDRRTSKTTVRVMSGDTFVLGGLRRRNENEVVSGIPGLMNIKYLGAIFRAHRTTVTESELVIFVHTEVIDVDYHGEPREQIAAQIVDETLEHIPYATHAPMFPPCNDPYCPYHNPRPRVWEGDVRAPEAPYPHTHAHGEAVPDGYLPTPDHTPSGHPSGSTQTTAPSATPTAPLAPARQQAPIRKPSQDAVPVPVEPPAPGLQGPPPVQVDEMARRKNGQMATYRLPNVSQETTKPSSLARQPAPAARGTTTIQQPSVATQKESWWNSIFR